MALSIEQDLVQTLNKALELMEFMEEDKSPNYDETIYNIILNYTLKVEQNPQ